MPKNHMPSRKGNFGGAQVLAQVTTFLEQLGGRRPKGWNDRLFLEGARERQKLNFRTFLGDRTEN